MLFSVFPVFLLVFGVSLAFAQPTGSYCRSNEGSFNCTLKQMYIIGPVQFSGLLLYSSGPLLVNGTCSFDRSFAVNMSDSSCQQNETAIQLIQCTNISDFVDTNQTLNGGLSCQQMWHQRSAVWIRCGNMSTDCIDIYDDKNDSYSGSSNDDVLLLLTILICCIGMVLVIFAVVPLHKWLYFLLELLQRFRRRHRLWDQQYQTASTNTPPQDDDVLLL